MFKTLRAKLIASYLLIALLSLILTTAAGAFLIQRYQQKAALAQRRALVTAIIQRLSELQHKRLRAPAFLQRMREEAQGIGGRILLISEHGVILYDTASEGDLTGQRVSLPQKPDRPLVRHYKGPKDQEYFLVLVPIDKAIGSFPSRFRSAQYLALAVPVGEIRQPWSELLPPLLAATALSLVVSIGVGILLSKSITQPLVAMTRASEEMARGNYQQHIPVRGDDEISRLAESFNRMSREVERARQTQRDFLANISHDLKTPLTSIRGFSQAILEGTVTDEVGYRRAAEIINAEAERMERLVRDLLELAKLEGGQAGLRYEPVDLSSLLHSCFTKYEPQAREKGISLRKDIPSHLPSIWGDGHRLEQAILNLLDNALKYTDRGGKVELRARVAAIGSSQSHEAPKADHIASTLPIALQGLSLSEGRWVLIEVADTGIGIPEEDLPRIFERFYRADKSRSGTEGSGLGLAIVKGIITAHGGQIGVESKLEEGSRFVVALPVGQPNAREGKSRRK